MVQNYQKMLDEVIEKNEAEKLKPSLLLHVCCAPCSSYVLEYLNGKFNMTAFFANDNISSIEEFAHRESELERFTGEFPIEKVDIIVKEYDHRIFLDMAKGLENVPEGGVRCRECYKMRLEQAAIEAKSGNFDYFTTTLSISPHKNAQWLNEIGAEMAEKYKVKYLFSDFKKKNGFKRSCTLASEYNLYRQSFCGCEFSKRDSREN